MFLDYNKNNVLNKVSEIVSDVFTVVEELTVGNKEISQWTSMPTGIQTVNMFNNCKIKRTTI